MEPHWPAKISGFAGSCQTSLGEEEEEEGEAFLRLCLAHTGISYVMAAHSGRHNNPDTWSIV